MFFYGDQDLIAYLQNCYEDTLQEVCDLNITSWREFSNFPIWEGSNPATIRIDNVLQHSSEESHKLIKYLLSVCIFNVFHLVRHQFLSSTICKNSELFTICLYKFFRSISKTKHKVVSSNF